MITMFRHNKKFHLYQKNKPKKKVKVLLSLKSNVVAVELKYIIKDKHRNNMRLHILNLASRF